MFLELETGPDQNEDEHRTFKTLFYQLLVLSATLYMSSTKLTSGKLVDSRRSLPRTSLRHPY